MTNNKKSNAVQIDINDLLEGVYNERVKVAKSTSLVTREQAFAELKKIEAVAKFTRVSRRIIAEELGVSRFRICSICTNGHKGKYALTPAAIMDVSNAYLRQLEMVNKALTQIIKNSDANK